MGSGSFTHPTAVRDLWVSTVGSGCRDWQGLQAWEVLGGLTQKGSPLREVAQGFVPGLYLSWRPREPLPTGGGSEGPRGLCNNDHTQEVGIWKPVLWPPKSIFKVRRVLLEAYPRRLLPGTGLL